MPRVRHAGAAAKRSVSDAASVATSTMTLGMSSPPPRSVSVIQLACLGFMVVSSGPFGLESAVAAAGFGPVFLAVLLLPWLWALPQALTMAELATMMPEVR